MSLRAEPRVGDHEHRGGSIEDAAEDLAEGLRVKRREALVEDHEVAFWRSARAM